MQLNITTNYVVVNLPWLKMLNDIEC